MPESTPSFIFKVPPFAAPSYRAPNQAAGKLSARRGPGIFAFNNTFETDVVRDVFDIDFRLRNCEKILSRDRR
jgi:hypothetical protein